MKRTSWFALLTVAALLLGLLSGCGGTASSTASSVSAAPAAASAEETAEPAASSGETPSSPEDDVPDYTITLNGDSISAEGAKVEGSTVTITKTGNYHVSGTLNDGQIIVDAKGEDIRIVLEGADISCSTSAPIYVKKAGMVNIWLAEGTENTVTDTANYVFAEGEDEPDAAIFAKDDLAIVGQGALTVHGNYDMGIHCKDSLFLNADITVDAVGDGVKGKDAVYLAECSLKITAGADGIQSNNDTEGGDIFIQSGEITVDAQGDGIKAEHALEITGGTIQITAQEDGLKAKNTIGGGYILIQDGEITIDAQGDAIQSDGDLTVEGGVIGAVTLGGSANAPEHAGDFFGGPPGWFNDTTSEDETASAKGIKAAYDLTITGGRISLDTYDDAIHADGNVTISGEPFIGVATGDDGIHANETLTIEGGDIQITQSYEGIEGLFIEISGGDVYVKASDDGMNANGDEMFGPGFGGMAGVSGELEDANTYLHITGGHVLVDAAGDGLDSNGLLLVEGGDIFVSGPSNSMNGALDSGTTARITGGKVVAIGASGMDETFDSESTQPTIKCTFNTYLDGSDPVTLTDSSGNAIAEFSIEVEGKRYNSVVISSPDLTIGETYTLTCGEETVEIELTDISTTVRQTAAGSSETSASGGFGGFGGPGGGPGGPPRR